MSGIHINDYGQPNPPEGEQTWTTDEMQRDFEPISFSAPFIRVRRRSDGVEGTLEFTHSPRRYFDFRPANGS
jgi:hypothetical protein